VRFLLLWCLWYNNVKVFAIQQSGDDCDGGPDIRMRKIDSLRRDVATPCAQEVGVFMQFCQRVKNTHA